VQLMKSGATTKRRSGSGEGELRNLFAGLLKCPLCKGSMSMVYKGVGGGHRKVCCANAKAGGGCDYRSLAYPPMEEVFLRRYRSVLKTAPAGDANLSAEWDNLVCGIDALEERRDNILKAITYGPSPTLAANLRSVEADIDAMRAEAKELGEKVAATSPKMLASRIADLKTTLGVAPLDRRKANAQLKAILSGVEVDYDAGALVFEWTHGGTNSIHYAFPTE